MAKKKVSPIKVHTRITREDQGHGFLGCVELESSPNGRLTMFFKSYATQEGAESHLKEVLDLLVTELQSHKPSLFKQETKYGVFAYDNVSHYGSEISGPPRTRPFMYSCVSSYGRMSEPYIAAKCVMIVLPVRTSQHRGRYTYTDPDGRKGEIVSDKTPLLFKSEAAAQMQLKNCLRWQAKELLRQANNADRDTLKLRKKHDDVCKKHDLLCAAPAHGKTKSPTRRRSNSDKLDVVTADAAPDSTQEPGDQETP